MATTTDTDRVIDLTDPVPRPTPVRRTVLTRSGSRYRIIGDRVRKLRPRGEDTDYQLIDMRGDRLRYTDGERLFISSAVTGSRLDPS